MYVKVFVIIKEFQKLFHNICPSLHTCTVVLCYKSKSREFITKFINFIEILMIQRSLRDDRLNRQKYRFHYIHLLPKLNKHSESIAEAIHVPYRPQ